MDEPSFFNENPASSADEGGASSWADWSDIKDKIKSAGETVGKVLPDLSDDAGHEEILHAEL